MATFNDRRSSAPESKILTSLWDGLSPHLIAKFYPVKKMQDGSGWVQSLDNRHVISESEKYVVDDGFEVHCPITDGTTEMTLGWTSPFENSGAESKAPTLSAMLQSGSLSPALLALGKGFGHDLTGSSAAVMLEKSSGRTGITKLNSTQVFSGMPPVKMSMTLHFRALKDPVKEVREPLLMLKQWALPQMLASDGLIAAGLKNGAQQGLIETVFPSLTPQIIGMKYGDMTYEPMVIESISEPFTNPRSSDGVMLSCSVQVTLATLTALDRRDIQKIYR